MSPNKLNDIMNSKKDYKRKYLKNYPFYNKVLKKLFENSISKLHDGEYFQTFQQIAITNKLNLENLVQITFNVKPNSSIIKLIQNKYPHVIIYINK